MKEITDNVLTEEENKKDLTIYCAVKEKKAKKEKNKTDNFKFENADFSGFFELAKLMDMSIDEAIDKCCMYQVKNLMSRMGKVIVRYNVTNEEVGAMLYNTSALDISETLFSPSYLTVCKAEINRNPDINQQVGVIIDFPFGESDFKSKLVSIKESLKQGVDSLTVMLPVICISKERKNELKRQIKRISRYNGVQKGIAVSAMDVNEEQIKLLLKLIEKYNIDFSTFVFGNVSLNELVEKINIVNKYKGKKIIKVLANVDSAEAITELFKLKTDIILTPYADEIGKELIERFKIKSLKLK